MRASDRIAVDEGELRIFQLRKRHSHGFPCGAQNIDSVDLLRKHLPDGGKDGRLPEKTFPHPHAFGMGQLLGIEDTCRNAFRIGEDHGGGNHGSGHAAAPGLIDPRDKRKPLGPLCCFAGEEFIPHGQKSFRRDSSRSGVFS